MATNNQVNVGLSGATGTGNFVGSTSPTLTTPNIGTPSAGTLTNCTGLPVAGGGTGNSSTTAYAVQCGGTTTTAAHQAVSGVGTSGQVLTSNGAGALPTWQAAAGGGDMTLLSTATASSSSSVDFTLDSGYRDYLVTFGAVTPATDGAEFQLRTSTDGGSTYDSGASDYARVLFRTSYNNGNSFSANSNGDSDIMLTVSSGNGTDETINGWLRVHSPASTKYTHITCDLSHVVTDATGEFSRCAGFRASAADVDAIRFLFSSGNISVGEFRLYGLNDS